MPGNLKALLLILGILTGFVITAQLRTEGVPSPDPYEPFYELNSSTESLSNLQKSLQDEVALLRTQVENAQMMAVAPTRVATLDGLKEEIGLTEVTGRGVVITLDDAVMDSETVTETPDDICYAADLRDLVNILRVGGATAIAINQQRVIQSTSIVCIGSSVLVNNIRMLPPFQISALTDDQDILETYLGTAKFLPTLLERKEQGQIVFDVESKRSVTLPVYKGNVETTYLE